MFSILLFIILEIVVLTFFGFFPALLCLFAAIIGATIEDKEENQLWEVQFKVNDVNYMELCNLKNPDEICFHLDSIAKLNNEKIEIIKIIKYQPN